MTVMTLHQSYVTQCCSLFTLISYFGSVISVALMFTDSWCTYARWLFFGFFISRVI